MRKAWVVKLAVALAVVAGGVAWVSQSPLAKLQQGLAAFRRDDFAAARANWIPLAKQGDAKAQFNLALMHANGQGAPKDYAEAARLYRLAADQGDANAQNNLGAMYANGQGLPQDYAEAARWYRLAADQGEASAQNNLGSLHESGHGVAQSYSEAASLYRQSASQGNAIAQNNLARLYIQGQGVPQDPVSAHMWANIAGANGAEAAPALRDSIAATLTPADLSEAQRRARECLASNYTRCD